MTPDWLSEVKTAAGRQAVFSEYGPRAVVGLLAGLLAIQAGFLVTSQSSVVGISTSAPTGARPGNTFNRAPPGGVNTPDASAARRTQTIVNAHLFGEARQNTVGDAPQTSAPLVLAGVLAVPNPEKGMAMLGSSAGTAKLYPVGGSVPGGVRLHAVYPDRVLLDRGGVIESLRLPTKISSTAAAPLAAVQSPAQRLAALAQGSGGGLLGGLIRAQPKLVGGKLAGYTIFPGGRANVTAFTQLGLRPGDMVTAVNGTPLDDPNRANEIMQTLSSSATANITVQRNGQSQDINLNLESVANDAENALAQGSMAERRGGAFGGPQGGNGGGFPGLRGSMIAPVPAPAENGNGTEPSPLPSEQ